MRLHVFGFDSSKLGDLGQFVANLLRTLRSLGSRLLNLQTLDFKRMHTALHRDNRAALLRGQDAQLLVFFISRVKCGFGARCGSLRISQSSGNFGQLTLTRNRAVHRFIRRKIREAVDAYQVTVTGDDDLANGETCAM